MMSLCSSSTLDEVSKLQQHLSLLRDQYSLLQEKCSKLQRERDVATASSSTDATSSFASRLLTFVEQLHDKADYSDLEVRVTDNRLLKAHKFVLTARSQHWETLSANDTLDWIDLGPGVGEAVLQWVYSGKLPQQQQDTPFMMMLMTAASRLALPHLLGSCEQEMVGRVTVRNCVKLYTTADEIGASTLRDHCSTLISAHWDDFTSEDFSHMSGPLLYTMFKSKTPRPLHAAVRHRREDVLFLYLIEHRSQLPGALDEVDESGSAALEVALSSGQRSVADTLLQHGAAVDTRDNAGATLLHRAIHRGDELATSYLLNHGATVNSRVPRTGMTPLHLLVAAADAVQGNLSLHGSPDHLHPLLGGGIPPASLTPLASSQQHLMNSEVHPYLASNYNTKGKSNGVVTPHNANHYNTPTGKYGVGTNGIIGSPTHSTPDHSESSKRSSSPPTFSQANSETASATSGSSFSAHQREKLCKMLLEKGADPNIQDSFKRSVFHYAVLSGERALCSALLQHRDSPSPQLELLDCHGRTALWYGLFQDAAGNQETLVFEATSVPALLLKHGADPNAIVGDNNDRLLHVACQRGAEAAGLFLISGGAAVNSHNSAGETPLHCTCSTGLPAVTVALLQHGANPNAQTLATVPISIPPPPDSTTHHIQVSGGDGGGTLSVSSRSSNDTTPSTNPFDELESPPPPQTPTTATGGDATVHSPSSGRGVIVPVHRETPLHRAIANGNEEDLRAILNHRGSSIPGASSAPLNLELRDSEDRPPLATALARGWLQCAELLVAAGASVISVDSQGRSYLHSAVLAGDVAAAGFLLNHGADPALRNREGQTALELCIHGGVSEPDLLEQLCKGGAALCPADEGGVLPRDPPLWQALLADRTDIAALLVKYGADTDWWHNNGDGLQHTLLHRAIDENLEEAAVFLLGSGCDASSPRRARGVASPDLRTPLHLCATWGLQATALALSQHGANCNAKDAEGKTPLHLAIENGHPGVIEVLLLQPSLDLSVRDKSGITPFAAAMARKNNQAARAILDKEPKAAEQFDHKGHNFLHVAVSKNDLESVLFLLSVHVDLSTTTRDENRLSPLQLATIAGSELLVRNLLLAGSDINAVTPQKQTVLHLAALHDHSHLAPVLLENRVNFDAIDADLNNSLHIAVKSGHVAMSRVLLTESQINATAVNLRGQNPLHLLAVFLPPTAPAIAKLFLEAMPDYPLDAPDVHGNTALLLAYQRGGAQLCRVLVTAGASLGLGNTQGETLFNSVVASRALLAALLDSLCKEPPWAEGDNCMQCGAKFSLATRRHHCRHCGRLLCSKCSDKLLPILKFGLNKPVRVCHICSQVLTLGPAALT